MLKRKPYNLAVTGITIMAAILLTAPAAIGATVAPSSAATTATHASHPVASHPVATATRNAPRIGADTTLGFVLNYNSGRCLGITGGEHEAPAVQFTCLSGHPDQQWHTGAANSAGYYQIVNGDGQCLGVQGGSTAQGARVYGWNCLGPSHPDQYWLYDGNITCGTYYSPIINYKSGRVLGVAGNSTANGAAVVIWSYQGVCNNQFWSHTG
jgi:Ricin-type beta-trefoil lectin domain-like